MYVEQINIPKWDKRLEYNSIEKRFNNKLILIKPVLLLWNGTRHVLNLI